MSGCGVIFDVCAINSPGTPAILQTLTDNAKPQGEYHGNQRQTRARHWWRHGHRSRDCLSRISLCPGYVDTPIIERNTTSIAQRAKLSEKDARAVMVNANRHKRLIAPEEVSATAMWLLGRGGDSVNGQAIEIAGGQM